MTTYGELLKTGIKILQEAGVPDAGKDAEWLLMAAAEKTRSFLFVHSGGKCPEKPAGQFIQYIQRRVSGEPVQYITGSQEFMGLSFDVNPSVLIPRQDTETLVELALEEAEKKEALVQVLDLCCGSGAIAVSVAHYLPMAEVTAADIREDSLETARRNAEKNGVADRITFMESDMFSAFRELPAGVEKASFDLILCNPPYIPTDVIPTLQREITEHEPAAALDGGPDGLAFYRILADEAWEFLKPGGLLMMEIGHDQAEEVCALLKRSGYYSDPVVIRDLAGRDRVVRCVTVHGFWKY